MNDFKVDSCKLSIPLSQCKLIDQSLLDHFEDVRLNTDTGEVEKLKEYVGKPYQLSFNDGTSVKVWIEKQVNYDTLTKEKRNEDYITFLANSKHLGKLYFNGITVDTLEPLYNYIMSLEVFKCDFHSFQSARYSDVDICYDFKCTKDEFLILKDNVMKSAIEPLYFNTEDKKNNSGIWAPTRKKPREQATPGKPFVKFYSKEADLTYHSYKFARTHLKPADYKDLVRFECTIKNAQHKRKLSLDKKPTFIQFLKTDLRLIASSIYLEYFKKLKTNRISSMTPTDKAFIDLINLSIENGASKSDIHKIFNRYDISPKARQRLLERYQKLYSTDKINKDKLQANEVTRNVFELLGVDVNSD